jgi:hypothetical protein
MSLLQCYSSGDRRFSALYARLVCGKTIEQVYQSAKMDEHGRPFAHPKGANPTYLYYSGGFHECDLELRHVFYTSLWYTYFRENPDLFLYACGHEGFFERHRNANIWYPKELSGPNAPYIFNSPGTPKTCDQALSIAWLVAHKNDPAPVLFPPDIMVMLEGYWTRYHK